MRVRILRGATQVGGSCVEVEQSGTRIVIDVGLPLERPGAYRDLLPDVPGLWATADGSLHAVLLSHTHPDHCGLADLVAPDVPVYCGAAAERIWNSASFYVPRMTPFAASGHFRHAVPLTLGHLRVTPWLVDHSGYDAYSLLIEGGGRRLLYSGDIRATGRKPRTLEAVATACRGVDALLLEGTRIRNDAIENTEGDVETDVARALRATCGMGLAFYSAMNIDRLVSLYRAARRADRTFVMDLYTAAVAHATGNPRVPQADWDGVRVYLPNNQKRRVIASGDFTAVNAVRPSRVFIDELAERPEAFVMTTRTSMLPELRTALGGAIAIWSMWDGYLDRDPRLTSTLRSYGVPVLHAHTSGHASRSTLQRFAAQIAPRRVIPIHTDSPSVFASAIDNVEPHGDGDWTCV
ncbi:MBL fold metallo-hydrolase [Conexibacter sp. W3-3-2]|uniref:MBL fold metallo-hydrolase n=1 Tax=Conexibacter sp. W3-3-2 TaxID=2675227 RepID=UPI0012BA0AE5|nr:MBL fold metallo-hydrolase [Conexibacter sp. W3-3-2]MTD44894.1 MBL fold metallo-hydrolase [Conexibacter sp. W3-3-2]